MRAGKLAWTFSRDAMKSLLMWLCIRSDRRLLYSRLILVLATFQVSIGLVLHTVWIVTDKWGWLAYYFDYQGAVYFISLDILKLWLSVMAWRQFKRKDGLQSAWFAISVAMGWMLAGDLLKHWLCIDTYLNPLHYVWQKWDPSAATTLHEWGSAIAGPLFMLTLAVGLFKGIQHYKKIRIIGRMKLVDWALVGATGIYALYVVDSVVRVAIRNPSDIRAGWILTWPNDLLLAVLLFEAILLVRTAVEMGQGYVVRAWEAFAVAIFLTSVESFSLWMTSYGYFPYQVNSVMWYVWFIWAAALAMAPAYQVDAVRIAESRVSDNPEPLRNPASIQAFHRS